MQEETYRLTRRQIMTLATIAGGMSAVTPLQAQFNLRKALGAAKKVSDAASFSDKDMALYFDQMSDNMDRKNPVAKPGSKYGQRIANLSRGLKTHDGLDLDIKAYLVRDVNAFAMANGTIRVFAGLMDKFDDDEVRYVIGHEIGHVKKEHTRKRMKSKLQKDAALGVIDTSGGRVARLSRSQLGNLFSDVITAQHSQKHEKEADDYAMGFMKQKSYNPNACITALEKLDSLSGPGGGGLPWLQTHPSPGSRAKRLRKKL